MKLKLVLHILAGSAIVFSTLLNSNILLGLPTTAQEQTVAALSASEVGKIAKQVTGQIERENNPGTGVIIKKEGWRFGGGAHYFVKTDV